MRRWRLGILVVMIVLTIFFVLSLADNPRFLNDLGRAIADVQLELSLTGLLAMVLFWAGIEVNHRSMNNPSNTSPRWNDFWQGISTELIGAVISAVVLGMIVLIFQQYSAIQNRKADLHIQLGSPDNTVATEAIRVYGAEEWLYDGTLENTQLWDADWTNGQLPCAELSGVEFWGTNLMGANMREVNLSHAELKNVDLSHSILWYAILADAVLIESSNLGNADLRNSDLSNANLTDTLFTEDTILPDGTNWTPETDMARFTNPEHSEFWNSYIEGDPITDFCEKLLQD